jgi:hypothetical protein
MSSLNFNTIISPFVSGDLSTAENSIWIVYAAVIIETVSSAKHITELWNWVSSEVKTEDKQLIVARRIREGLLKTSPLAGFPKVRLLSTFELNSNCCQGINTLGALRSAVKETSPSVAETLESDKSLRADHSAAVLEKRGKEFFSRVYSKFTDRVQQNMALSSGGDLDQFAMLSIYGGLMAEERILNAKETGLMEFIVCYVSGAAPQAKGHMYGSRNLGNGREGILKGIKLGNDMVKALKVSLDVDSMDFIKKVEGW